MKVTIGNVKNEKQANRAIKALESAFNIVRPVGKEIIVKDDYKAKYEVLEAEYNNYKVACDELKKQFEDKNNRFQGKLKEIDELKTHIETLNDEINDLSNKVSSLRDVNNDLKNNLSESHREYQELLEAHQSTIDEVERLELKIRELEANNKPYDLNDIKVIPLCPIETCDTVEKAILTSGWTEPEPLPSPNIDREFSNETTPKMDGSLNRKVRKELDKWGELLDNDILEDELKKDKKAKDDLSDRVQIPAEPDYIPPKIDLSVIAIPTNVFIRNKTKSINNWETKNAEIIDTIHAFRPVEEDSNTTNKEYKSMYSKVSKFLNRDTLKAIRRKVFASDNNTVKKLYKKCYLELLVKIYNIIITDKMPIDSDSNDTEAKTNEANINATLEDKSHQSKLMNEIEDIKASLSVKVDKAVAKVENKDIELTNGTEVKQWAINEIKKVKANNSIVWCSDIPYPYKKTHELLKRLRKFMSNDEVLHLLNILIGDDVFRGKTYERYIPNIKYWCVVRKLNKVLKDIP